MYLLDVNVVLAAHRSDHPHYQTVRPWFDYLIAREKQFTVPLTVWTG
jgi:predicted nucleic acid-binding protein